MSQLDFGRIISGGSRVAHSKFGNCGLELLGSESFKALIEVANRQLVVKSPRTVSRKVDHSASRVLSDVCDILSAVKSTIPSVGFTTDMWTSLAQVVILIFQP